MRQAVDVAVLGSEPVDDGLSARAAKGDRPQLARKETARTALRRARRMLVLQPDDASEIMQATGVKAPMRPGQQMVPGRGVLVVDRAPAIVQLAMP